MFLIAHLVRLIEHDATKNYSADAGFRNFVTENELNKKLGGSERPLRYFAKQNSFLSQIFASSENFSSSIEFFQLVASLQRGKSSRGRNSRGQKLRLIL